MRHPRLYYTTYYPEYRYTHLPVRLDEQIIEDEKGGTSHLNENQNLNETDLVPVKDVPELRCPYTSVDVWSPTFPNVDKERVFSTLQRFVWFSSWSCE